MKKSFPFLVFVLHGKAHRTRMARPIKFNAVHQTARENYKVCVIDLQVLHAEWPFSSKFSKLHL